MELVPRARSVAVACCAVLASAGVPALGDDAGLPGPGDRVRVHVAGGSSAPLVGKLAALDAHSLAVKVPGPDAAAVVARADLLRVERSIRPGRKGKGALIGLGAGFAIGFVGAALLGNCDETGGTDHCVNAVWGSLYGAAAGAAGAGLGALVAPGERWADVPVGLLSAPIGGHESSARVEVVPLLGRRHGLAIAVSFR